MSRLNTNQSWPCIASEIEWDPAHAGCNSSRWLRLLIPLHCRKLSKQGGLISTRAEDLLGWCVLWAWPPRLFELPVGTINFLQDAFLGSLKRIILIPNDLHSNSWEFIFFFKCTLSTEVWLAFHCRKRKTIQLPQLIPKFLAFGLNSFERHPFSPLYIVHVKLCVF